MKKTLFWFILIILAIPYTLHATPSYAIDDPLAKTNNKFGIHILFPSELNAAAELINSSGGDWGYVTIPIQATDRDLLKWQSFMDDAKMKHLIPIIRLATDGDYFNTKVWRKPTEDDVLDFANFLNSLTWPTKNRYVMIFNEVNRGDEWGGSANASEYANLLSYAYTVFKSKNYDFFILPAGLDNDAPNNGSTFINEYTYLTQMNNAVPGIFNQIDGWNSHSYPNPGFSQPPSYAGRNSIHSFQTEKSYVESLSNKKLPVFITETGWTNTTLSDEQRAAYYKEAFSNAWADGSIVAVTPFLLLAGGGPFGQFSFLDVNNNHTKQYDAFKAFPKLKGQPSLMPSVLSAEIRPNLTETKSFPEKKSPKRFSPTSIMTNVFGWMFKL